MHCYSPLNLVRQSLGGISAWWLVLRVRSPQAGYAVTSLGLRCVDPTRTGTDSIVVSLEREP
jgi:hypothetical protein